MAVCWDAMMSESYGIGCKVKLPSCHLDSADDECTASMLRSCASPSSPALVSSPPYEAVGGYYREEAIMLLRRFYLTENSNGEESTLIVEVGLAPQVSDRPASSPLLPRHLTAPNPKNKAKRVLKTEVQRESGSAALRVFQGSNSDLLPLNPLVSLPHHCIQPPAYRCTASMLTVQRPWRMAQHHACGQTRPSLVKAERVSRPSSAASLPWHLFLYRILARHHLVICRRRCTSGSCRLPL